MPELHEYERKFKQPRSLETRLIEYRDSLRSLTVQLEEVAERVEQLGGDPSEIHSGLRLQRTITDDLTKIIDGVELQMFVVDGEL